MTDAPRKGRRRLPKILAALALLLVLGFAALWIASARACESLPAYTLEAVLRLLDVKHTMRSPEAFQVAIQGSQAKGEEPPAESLNKNYLVSHEAFEGGEVYTLTPRSWDRRKTVLFIHGGAYCGPITAIYWDLLGKIGARTGARFVVPLYPLAPAHDWKQAYAMLDRLYDRLLGEAAPASITIVGDSAGGGLALGLAEALRDAGKPAAAGLVLISPWLNLEKDNPAQEAVDALDIGLSRPALEWAAEHWANGTPLNDPHISPVFGSLRGLPPMLVFSGTHDLLNPDSLQLAQRAHAEGAALTYVEGHNMIHDWPLLPLPETRPVLDRIASFVSTGSASTTSR